MHPVVPVFTQYQSPELIADIAYGGRSPAEDPRWRESGASSREEYARWAPHCCGLACLQMILAHRDGTAPALLDLLHDCVPYGTYQEQPDGSIRGLFYAPFVTYANERHNLDGTVHTELTIEQVRDQLDRGRLVIASVHREIRRPREDPPRRGGHLVLIVAHDDEALHFHNPSGHTPNTRRATLPDADFERFYAQRGMSVATTTS